MMKQYKAKNGRMQWMPSLKEATEADADYEGFCLACGETQEGVEPDAVRYECESCGKAKVFGAAELVLLGLVY